MKSIELHTTENALGPTDPANRRHYADGRRITREEYDRLKADALRRGTLDTFHSHTAGGVRHCYCHARLP